MFVIFQHLEHLMKTFTFVCEMRDIAIVQTLTSIIDALIYCNSKDNINAMKSATPGI